LPASGSRRAIATRIGAPARPTGFGLSVQLLNPNQRVLVLGSVAGTRRGDGWFAPDEVLALFDALRLPRPVAVLRSLGQLSAPNLVRGRTDGDWTLTPLGEAELATIMGTIDYASLSVEMAGTPGAEFASAHHTTVSPLMAPARWQPGIARLTAISPFEKNIFCMTRFPRQGDPLPDPVPAVIETLRASALAHGMMLHVASDAQRQDDLFGNVGAYMWACQYGIGLLENRQGADAGVKDNVLIELGSMLVTGRRCAILKDGSAAQPASDLTAEIYKSVDFDDQGAISRAMHTWIRDDLGLGTCGGCPQ
jgi:hypothetical protein